MTGSQIFQHILGVLTDYPNHTIVRHKNASGTLCWRIRDCKVNPIANFTDNVMNELQDNNLLTKLNEREWQLNQQQLNLLNKKQNTSAK